jgi:ligand-binding sensor domain-containing protein
MKRTKFTVPRIVKAVMASLAACFFIIQAVAQTNNAEPIFYPITEQNGLSDDVVTCFLQDSRNFMWIGTQDGLNVYDGSAFKIYRSSNNKSRDELAHNSINTLAEDAHKHIWIGTSNGLSMYDMLSGEIHTWRIDSTEDTEEKNNIRRLTIDSNEKIWLATANGLYRFDPFTARFKTFRVGTIQKSDFNRSNNHLVDLLIDQQNRFWIATFNGLWRFFPGDGHFEQYLRSSDVSPAQGLVTKIYQDHIGQLWLGFWSGGLKRFDPDKKLIKNFHPFNEKDGKISDVAELQDGKGNYHMYTAPKLNEFNPGGGTFNFFPGSDPTNKKLNVSVLYVSKQNLLWMATDRGIRIMDPDKQVFHHYFLSSVNISGQGISLLMSGKNIYVGGWQHNFLKCYDASFQLIKNLLPDFTVTRSGKKIHPCLLSIVREDSIHLWLCTEQGLVLYNELSGSGNIFPVEPHDSSLPATDFINNLFIDSRGRHWVFPWRSGIWEIDPSSKKIRKIFTGFLNEFETTKPLLVSAAAEDRLGNIWFADLDEGLIHYDYSTGKFSKPAEKEIGPKFGLQNIFFEEPFVWFVTNGRVCRIHEASGKIEQWPIPPVFNKSITGFCGDLFNHIWITTINGLICFDRAAHSFKRFTVNDGLLNNQMEGFILACDNHKIIYAADNYLTVFNPDDLLKTSLTTGVQITGISSQNKSVQVERKNNGEKFIGLDHTYDNFTFSWALPDFRNPLQNQYYCKLEGVDRDWKYAGNKGEMQYASLGPGTYIFKARAAAGNGIMSTQEDKIIISISPPFTKHWWFSCSVMLVIGVILYFIYRIRLNQVLKMERLRSRISGDLHDDIGSTLSSISIISEIAMKDTGTGFPALIREIKDNSISLMEKMDDIVWSINPKNDSLENLFLRIKHFASTVFEAKDIYYTIDIEDDIKNIRLPMEYRQHIFLIMKEAINNLVKYSSCTKVSIMVNYTNEILIVEISDNGRGFIKPDQFTGNGILNMNNRASKIRGTLVIDSQINKGTRVHLKVKLKRIRPMKKFSF